MASKKMFFYKIVLRENGVELTAQETKNAILTIIRTHQTGGAINLDSEYEKITMDEITIEDSFVFARLGKKQELSSLAKRKINRSAEPILDATEIDTWVDKLTYMIINFELRLFSVVKSNSAPGAGSLRSLFSLYHPGIDVEFVSIPNNSYYTRLFTPGSAINKISFKIPVPNVQFLERIPGLSSRQIEKIMDMDVKFAEISIMNEPKRFLTNDKDTIEDYVLDLSESLENFDKVEITGKPFNSTTHTFDMKDEYFGYNITVNTTRRVGGEVEEKSLTEVKVDFRTKMIAAINEHWDFLVAALS